MKKDEIADNEAVAAQIIACDICSNNYNNVKSFNYHLNENLPR